MVLLDWYLVPKCLPLISIIWAIPYWYKLTPGLYMNLFQNFINKFTGSLYINIKGPSWDMDIPHDGPSIYSHFGPYITRTCPNKKLTKFHMNKFPMALYIIYKVPYWVYNHLNMSPNDTHQPYWYITRGLYDFNWIEFIYNNSICPQVTGWNWWGGVGWLPLTPPRHIPITIWVYNIWKTLIGHYDYYIEFNGIQSL